MNEETFTTCHRSSVCSRPVAVHPFTTCHRSPVHDLSPFTCSRPRGTVVATYASGKLRLSLNSTPLGTLVVSSSILDSNKVHTVNGQGFLVNDMSVQKVLRLFDRAAWIITSSSGNEMGGLVATFVNNASLVPTLPRLLAGIARHHYTWELIHRSRAFAAHLVDEDHCELIWRFGLGSGRSINKFEGVRCRRGPTGSPVLTDALAWLDCSVETELDIGDRTIYVAAVVDGDVSRTGAAVTSNRIVELADEAQLRRMQEERGRDEKLDAAAILDWRNSLKG